MKFANMLRDGKTIDGQVILSAGMWNLMHTARVSFPNNTFRINDEPFCGYGWNLIGRVMENVGKLNTQHPLVNSVGAERQRPIFG